MATPDAGQGSKADERGRLKYEVRGMIESARSHSDTMAEFWAYRALLGAAGIALWFWLSATWITLEDDDRSADLSGWSLLGAGIRRLGDEDLVRASGGDLSRESALISFVVGVMPPAACLIALGALVYAAIYGTRRWAQVASALCTLAGLGQLGLMMVGNVAATDDAAWDTRSVVFAGMIVWFVSAALAACLARTAADLGFGSWWRAR